MSTTKGYLHLAGSSPLAIRRLTLFSDSFSRSATSRTVSSCGARTSVAIASDYRRVATTSILTQMLVAVSALDVAFVGSLAAVVSAVVSPLSAWLIARATTRSTSAQAREERIYQSRIDAYDEALLDAHKMQAAAVTIVARSDPSIVSPGVIDFPDVNERLRMIARLEVRGSDAMGEAFGELGQELQALAKDSQQFRGDDGSRQPTPQEVDQLRKRKDAVVDARRKLAKLARSDLRHR